MEEHIYPLFYKIEKEHWWFTARQKIILEYIKKHVNISKETTLLDVGCGTGAIIEMLSNHFNTYGLDSSPQAIEFCRKRGLTNLFQGNLESFNKDRKFDIITILDVIEHIDDDVKLLRQSNELLKENGSVVVTVPAFQFLWSYHDIVTHHKRRYTKNQLIKVVKSAGFQIKHITYFNSLLFPIAVLKRMASKIIGFKDTSDLNIPPQLINKLLKLIFQSEAEIINRISLPLGLSLLCLGEKTKK